MSPFTSRSCSCSHKPTAKALRGGLLQAFLIVLAHSSCFLPCFQLKVNDAFVPGFKVKSVSLATVVSGNATLSCDLSILCLPVFFV